MLSIEKIDTNNKVQVKRFVEFPYRLYKDCPQWVPPLYLDAYLLLNRKKHPFFGHSEADFFLAVRAGEVVGRICAAHNKPFNEYHKTKKAQFYALTRSMIWMLRDHFLTRSLTGRESAASIR